MSTPGNAEPQLGHEKDFANPGPDGPRHPGWYSRGYLPHADFPGTLQFVTYRLSDSLPTDALEGWRRELDKLPEERRTIERRKRMEAVLDAGHGCCALKEPKVAGLVVETWHRFAPERYDLVAWVVMPNHVHVLIRVREGWALGKIVQSWKSFTGRRIVASHGVPWMREYWDRFIRDEKHFAATISYIRTNPVKAGFVRRSEDWRWSSAREFAELGLGDPRDHRI